SRTQSEQTLIDLIANSKIGRDDVSRHQRADQLRVARADELDLPRAYKCAKLGDPCGIKSLDLLQRIARKLDADRSVGCRQRQQGPIAALNDRQTVTLLDG